MVDTLNTKVEFLFTRVAEVEKVNKKMAEPSIKPIDDKVIPLINPKDTSIIADLNE